MNTQNKIHKLRLANRRTYTRPTVIKYLQDAQNEIYDLQNEIYDLTQLLGGAKIDNVKQEQKYQEQHKQITLEKDNKIQELQNEIKELKKISEKLALFYVQRQEEFK